MRGAPPPRIEEGAIMSVYTKDRAHTTFTPVDNAAKLMDEITLYVYKERYVPKKYRLTLGTDLIRKADELYDNVTYANRIFYNKDHKENLPLRRSYWNKAAANCDQLDRKLQRIRFVIQAATIESMKNVIELLNAQKGAIAERLDRER